MFMWFGDCIQDAVTNLIEDDKDDDRAKEEALETIQLMIERNKKEMFWLEKFKRMIEERWDD